jgi:hypothetical protein
MSVSKNHVKQPTQSTQSPGETTASFADLPSSHGDSPKRVTPKDISPDDAAWKDLKVSDTGGDRAQPHKAAQAQTAGARRSAGDDTPTTNVDLSALPSSHGDSPRSMTPKDVSPDDAAWNDLKPRGLQEQSAAQHQEALIDEGSELSFPASDPPSHTPEATGCAQGEECASEDEEQLDDAIEMTFPASDPIAVKQISKISVDKSSPGR